MQSVQIKDVASLADCATVQVCQNEPVFFSCCSSAKDPSAGISDVGPQGQGVGVTGVLNPKTSWREPASQGDLCGWAIHKPSQRAAGESQKEDLRGRWKKRGLSLKKPKGVTCVRETGVPEALSVGRQEAGPH